MDDRLTYEPATFEDLDDLVAVRIAAMRESLERIGRFDPARVRSRLADSFDPGRTHWIALDGARVGFYSLVPFEDGLKLTHLYVNPSHHGRGVGSEVMRYLIAQNIDSPLYLNALQQSDANRFYQRHGFQITHEDEFDVYYVRPGSPLM